MALIHFTQAEIDKLPLPTKKEQQAIYFDKGFAGLGLRVGHKGTKTYFAEGRLNGRKKRITIGKHPNYIPGTLGDTSNRSARKRASQILRELADGTDHKAVKAEKKAKGTTLASIYDQFKEKRKLRPETIKGYDGAMRRCFADWQDLAITDISRHRIEQRYEKLLSQEWQRGTNGTAQANLAMRVLRSVLNYAGASLENSRGESVLPDNPVRRLSATKSWQKVAERDSYIKPHELKSWYKAVCKLDETLRDYMLLILFTGLRRNEASQLRWSEIDFNDSTLCIPPEKTKNKLKHTLPLSDYVEALLKKRNDDYTKALEKDIRKPDNDYVFYGKGETGHLIESKSSAVKVTKASGVQFMIHDLRRSFLTYAEALDVPHYALKKLANHKSSDITGKYVQLQVDRLREPMQLVTDYIKEKCGIKDAPTTKSKKNNSIKTKSNNVVAITTKRKHK